MDIIELVYKYELGEVLLNENFSNYLTIKTSGLIKYLIKPNNIYSLRIIIKYLNNINKKYLILGNGSNIYSRSEHIEEYVIYIKSLKQEYEIINDNILKITASYFMPKISLELAKNNYKNLEYFSGIPGTIGGIIAMNAGAYNHEIKDFLLKVIIIDNKGEIKELEKKDIIFSYRNSSIKENKDIVLLAYFKIEKTNENIYEKIKKWKEYRLNTQPINYPSFGCVFKNPKNDSAWKIVDKLGYRGFNYKNLEVSKLHTNFIINLNNGKGEDINKLIAEIKNKAKEKLNIILEEELIYLE